MLPAAGVHQTRRRVLAAITKETHNVIRNSRYPHRCS
ncbi:MAG: hypothetical protein ACJAVI_003332, partial [Candidatus Azotimanducaceae bacterium]